jgi:hypothetical protein
MNDFRGLDLHYLFKWKNYTENQAGGKSPPRRGRLSRRPNGGGYDRDFLANTT